MAGQSWIQHAREELLKFRGQQPGWAYRPGGELYSEPTVLAALALAATEDGEQATAYLKTSGDWLAGLQQANGAVGISATHAEPAWCTSHALLLWHAAGGYEAPCQSAVNFLLSRKGDTFPVSKDAVVGHDTSIPGWPWVADTHSWIEPTAMALLALRVSGQAQHSRVSEGLRMIRDRAIPEGGWNYGNSATFGRSLRPQLAPTGLALLTLAPVEKQRTELVSRALAYLQRALPNVRAAQSLSWGLLALSAWEERPADADQWLAESYRQAGKRADPAMQIAHVLLASTDKTLDFLASHRPPEAG